MAIRYSNDPNAGYGSGNDPKGRLQNQSAHQQLRYEQQQGPVANQAGLNYGRASEANWGDYNDIMNNYRDIARGGGGAGEGGGGGGGSDFNGMGMYSPFTVSYSDPFKSYAGFEDFSQTGGYSPNDIANMRARGVSPIRSAYANAEREVGRQRSLQGGYAPNAIASLAKMAREQGQATADATQGVEAGLAQQRQQGRLAGLTGMSGIEGKRLDAELQAGMYNAGAQERAQANNIQAGESAAGRSSASRAANMNDRFNALEGMRLTYGTSPGMAETFGNQAINITGQGGQIGQSQYGNDIRAQAMPGAWDQGVSRVNDAFDTFNRGTSAVYPWLNDERKKQLQPQVQPQVQQQYQRSR